MISLNIKTISTILGILVTISAFGVWIYSYHMTFSTKKDGALMYAELRIKDVQDSVAYYSGRSNLDEYDKDQLGKLKRTLERLEIQREKLMGYSGD